MNNRRDKAPHPNSYRMRYDGPTHSERVFFFLVGMGTAAMVALLAFLLFLTYAAPAGGTTIMPMGDSITVGYAEPGGSYRAYMAAADPTLTFVGDYYKVGWHQGKGGHTVQEMVADYGPAVQAHDPAVVLLLAGTNNHWAGATVADYQALLGLLGGRRVIAATVPRFGYGRVPATAYWTEEWVDNRNNVTFPAINAALAEAISLTPNASLVDYYAALDPATDLVADAVHPNAAGQAKLAALFAAELHRRPGDLDGDGDIDGADLSTTFANYTGPGPVGMLPHQGNLDGDGDVDGADLSMMFVAFENPEVPEPCAMVALAAGFALTTCRRSPHVSQKR